MKTETKNATCAADGISKARTGRSKFGFIAALICAMIVCLSFALVAAWLSPGKEAKAADVSGITTVEALQDGVAGAVSSDSDTTLTLGGNIAADYTAEGGLLTLPEQLTHKLTIDLNGFTLRVDTSGDCACLDVAKGVELVVKNGTLAGSSNGSFAFVQSEANVTLEDVKIEFDGADQTDSYVVWSNGYCTFDNVQINATGVKEYVNSYPNNVTYATLQDEINAATPGKTATVELTADADANLVIPEDKNIILDLKGNELTSDVEDVATIHNKGTLSIVDTAEVKGTITRGPTTYYVIRNDGDMTISAVTVKNDNAGDTSSLVANSPTGNGATLRIESGTFTSAGSNAVKNDPNGEIVIENGTFSSASGSHAAVFNWAKVTINGGTFVNTANSGKALFVGACNGDHNTTVVTGGTFEADSAVYMQNGDKDKPKGTFELTIENGTFKGAVETVNHGFNVTNDDKITVTGGTFKDKVAVGRTLQAAFSGGEYAQALDPEWYAADADIVQYKTEDGKYGIGETVPEGADVCVVIDNTYHIGYTSLIEALSSPQSYTLTLYADVDEQIVAGEGVNKAIDLNGFDITYSGNGAVITNNGKLNITDGTKSGVSCIYKASGSSGSVIVNNGTLTMRNYGYTVSTENSDALIVNNAGGTFQITLSSVATYFKANGTAIDNSGTFRITTADNAAVITADVALNNNGEATIKGGTFSGKITGTASGFLSGGTFNTVVSGSYVADGYMLAQNGDGTYGVLNDEEAAENFAAKVTSKEGSVAYKTLAAAVTAAEAGDTVTLLGNATVNPSVTINKSITIDLGGFTVNNPGTSHVFVITADGVTIENGSLTGQKVISASNAGNITLKHVTITGTGNSDEAVRIYNASVTLDGVTLDAQTIGVRTWEGGSVYVIGGSKLTSDYITLWALAGTSATVNDSTINAEGGAACYYAIYAQGEVNVTNSTLNSDYIAVEANNGATVVLDKATINVTYNNGMGIGIGTGENTSVTVKGSTINADDVTGGIGIQIYGAYNASKDPDKLQEAINDAEGRKYTSLTVEGTKIDAYYSAVMGNGNYHGSFITIADSELTSDTTAIYHPQYGNMTLSGNTTVTGGTGIEMRAGTLTINDDTVSVTATADFEEQANGNGSTLLGVAIGISQHNTNAPVNVAVGGGTFTANGNGGYAFYEVDLQDKTTEGVTVALSGGTFNGAVESENMSGFVSGGEFANRVPAEYLAEGNKQIYTDGGYVIGTDEELADYDAVAVVDSTSVMYTSLADALEAAPAGATVKLLADAELTAAVTLDEAITFDLNGFDVTSAVSGSYSIKIIADGVTITDSTDGDSVITAPNIALFVSGGKVTVKNIDIKSTGSGAAMQVGNAAGSAATLDGVNMTSYDGIYVMGHMDFESAKAADIGDYNSLTVTGNSVITAQRYGIVGLGTSHGTNVTITDSTIKTTGVEATVGEAAGKTTSTTIFQPQYGVLTISGNTTIEGYTGIEMRSGKLAISDGVTVETVATADNFFSISNGSGTTLGAVAVGVSQHGTELPVDVNISGGTFVAGEGCYAFYETDNMSETPSEGVTVALSGGTFNGAVESENMSGFVSGGKFANAIPAKYLAENFALSVSGGVYTVVGSENPEAKLTADGVGYTFATLEDAISAAASGDTITLLGDVTVDSTIDVKKAIDLDLGGFTVTSTIEEGETESKPVFRFSAGDDVTIKNGTIAAKGTALEFVGTSMTGKATYTLASDLTVTSETSAIFAYGGLKLISSATVESVGAAILTHGSERGTTNINITGGSLTSTNSVAMYLPQKTGTINISGGTITGKTGIEIRNGTLNITGGEIIATGAELVTVPNGSGSTVNSGAAVAISKYTGSINSLKVNISGGTLKGVYAVYEANLNPDSAEIAVDKMTVVLSDGTFDGAVESENLTAFITGGRYASQPAEDYFDPDYIAAYRDGWFVPVESSALRAAQTDAQADVRMYAAVLGLGWADITAAAETDDDAALIAAAYEAIAETTSEKAVAEARLAAMDAVDAYIAKLAAELASYKQDAIGRIDAAAAAGEGTTAVVVPTATYAAIMNAATTAEVDMYEANAMKEIADVRAFRAEIAAQTETLGELAGSLETLGTTIGGEFDQLLTDVRAAIRDAKDAVLEGTSEQLSDVQTALEAKIDAVMSKLTDTAQSLAGSLETLGTTIGGEFDQLLTDVRTAISEAQTATGTAITGAVSSLTTKIEEVKTALNEAVTDLTGELGTLASSLETLGTTIGGEFDQLLTDVRTAISEAQTATGTAISGAVSSLTAKIEEVRIALDTAVGQLEETLGAYNDALDGYNTQLAGLTGSLATASKELEAAIAAAQGDLDAIADKLDTLATGADADEIAAAIAAIKTTVDSIAANVDAASAVEEAKTDALTEIEDWLGAYLDDLLGTAQTSGCVTASAYTPETEDGELYDRLVDAFGKDNAALVLKYYNDALAAIDEAQTMSDVTTAVSTFKAQVASVESASGNAPGLAGVYVLLVIVLIVAAAAAVLLVLGMMKKQPAPAAPAPTADKPEEKKNEEIKEDRKEEEAAVETAAADSAADDDDDRERVVISANVRTFDEAYAELPDESRELFDKVKDYALSKEGTREAKMSNGVCVKYGSKKVVRLTVRRGNPVAMFVLENEMLKDFRRTANSNAKLKVHETELVIREEADLDTAFKMVDITVEQIGKDIEAAKERRREARRARRARRAEDAAAENAADEQETDSPETAAEAEDKTDGAEDGKEE